MCIRILFAHDEIKNQMRSSLSGIWQEAAAGSSLHMPRIHAKKWKSCSDGSHIVASVRPIPCGQITLTYDCATDYCVTYGMKVREFEIKEQRHGAHHTDVMHQTWLITVLEIGENTAICNDFVRQYHMPACATYSL